MKAEGVGYGGDGKAPVIVFKKHKAEIKDVI